MPFGRMRVDQKICEVKPPPHPCDPQPFCDPHAEPEGDCPEPTLCLERLKNPALPHELKRCTPGAYMNVKQCIKPEPPHPCDPIRPCTMEDMKKQPCDDPALCIERIKNPERVKAAPKFCDASAIFAQWRKEREQKIIEEREELDRKEAEELVVIRENCEKIRLRKQRLAKSKE